MSQPASLSVVIPVLNGAAGLGRQLDALLAQRWSGTFEVVVADDGSTDGTREIVLARAERDARLRLVEPYGLRGVCAARNRGTRASTGEAVAYVDADDLVAEGWLAAVAASLASSEIAAGRLEYDLLNPSWAADVRGRPLSRRLRVGRHDEAWPWAFGSNMAVRRDVFDAVDGFDERFVGGGNDKDFCWRAQKAGATLAWTPDAVVHYACRSDLAGIRRQARGYGRGDVWLSRLHEHASEPAPVGSRAEREARHLLALARHARSRTSYAKAVWRRGYVEGVAEARAVDGFPEPRPGHGVGTP